MKLMFPPLLYFLLSPLIFGDVTLPNIINSHMVLQQDKALPIWGWADAQEEILVGINGNEVATRADARGNWKVTLPPMKAGGPFQMTVQGKNRIVLEHILVGEVWLCSGQSNMEWEVRLCHNAEEALKGAQHPKIRLFHVPKQPSGHPQKDTDSKWRVCTPDTAADFSGVAYFFGKKLHQELKVPVGLIASSWGGTMIEPWTPIAGFESNKNLKEITERIKKEEIRYRQELNSVIGPLKQWVDEADGAIKNKTPIPIMPLCPIHPLCSHEQPTGLYNGMIHPLAPFALRGVLWYQGEQNIRDGMVYYEKMKGLIQGWRRVWGQGDFPFYFVQIAPFNYEQGGEYLPMLREAQRFSLRIPNTGMAVTTDIGVLDDIHPQNKMEVGRRLALIALNKTYGQKQRVCSGPLFRSVRIEGFQARVFFDFVGSGLGARDNQPLDWFEIAGENKTFFQAEARIEGDTVLVYSKQVKEPKFVRLGWRQDAMPNLINLEGLPASPFSSVTQFKKAD